MKNTYSCCAGDTKLAADVECGLIRSLMEEAAASIAYLSRSGPVRRCLFKVRQQQGDCSTGMLLLFAGDLPAKAVVHTVGPVWRW